MDKKRLLGLLTLEAVLCAAGALIFARRGGTAAGLLAFPFEQIGAGLRALSLSGGAGNAAALTLYLVICLLPAGYLLLGAVRGRLRAEDALLAVLSAVLLFVMHRMVNPARIGAQFGAAAMIPAGKMMLGGVVYSVAAGYLVLRILRRIAESGDAGLFRSLRAVLGAVCVLLVFAVCGSGLSGLAETVGGFLAANTDGGSGIGVSIVFLALQYGVSVLPALLEIAIIFAGFDLLQAMEKDSYSEQTVASARRLGRLCRVVVAAIMLSQIAVNLAQLLMGPLVRSGAYTANIPLLSIAVVLAAMLLARHIEQGRRLKDENDRFI